MKPKNIRLVGIVLEIDGEKKEFNKFELCPWAYSNEDDYTSDSGIDLTVKINDRDVKIPIESVY